MANQSLPELFPWLQESIFPAHLPVKLSFKSLQVFAAICETGSFRAAGERTHITTATVSAHVSGLEKLLGITLIDRNNKKININQNGAGLYPLAVCALDQIPSPSPHLRIETLLTFLTLVFCGHVTYTAKTLGISIASVIGRVDILEKNQGVTLFRRQAKKGYRLTPEGYSFLKKTMRILQLFKP